mmetsp:Transcript_6258/g.7281  ORF Transcript_6258/g.7281 Transcript_6258/m.7281 type:complete len:383 (+) Transcript_6258:97-1245(+)|eukprot:CAMPEP_0198252866 /NCGR_PEP_ID=MMETSP1447-20131203/3318_1 /TAXON_ID=420782 /ORGANISM="Chaetoceros dichaeta, Strain CCMP1751" /LENGTH=382 /DNA_ID=CAMNT_0043938269 /DNA_START=80 /DNA_END=1231 /DNA_ORIENTATION=-
MTKLVCPVLCPVMFLLATTAIITASSSIVQAFVPTPSSISLGIATNLQSVERSSKIARATTTIKTRLLPNEALSRCHKYYSTLRDTNEDVVLYSDDDYDDDVDDDDEGSGGGGGGTPWDQSSRWHNLSPSVKKRIVKEAEDRAVRNKKKREPSSEKKRRLMMFYKKLEIKSKRASRTTRPMPTNSPDRTTLSSLQTGQALNGTVISLANFGAYIDVGSECDGLLHVSQITREQFVEHPRQVLHPGDEVQVWLVRCSPEMKKMQLTMLPSTLGGENDDEEEEDEEGEERIQLEDLSINDELWGKITRVTSFGAYVELGAEAKGWLHFMDHPEFTMGMVPAEFMGVGDRIRCWVVNVEADRDRLKLTANRPDNLPGPRREMIMQ